jgi:hypothetical protein
MGSRTFRCRLPSFLIAFLFILLLVFPLLLPRDTNAISNCHDFTYYRLTGIDYKDKDHKMLDPGRLERILGLSGYRCQPYTSGMVLRARDVVFFGGQHSGVINESGQLDEYFETQVDVPGRTMKQLQEISPINIRNQATYSNSRTIEETAAMKRYKTSEIRICRQVPAGPDQIHFVEPQGQSTGPYYAVQYTVSEDAGTITIPVIRKGFGVGAATVEIKPSSASTANSKYILTTWKVEWAANELGEKRIALNIVNNDDEEGTQTVYLRFGAITGNVAAVDPNEARIFIVDKDMGGQISFTSDQYTVNVKDKAATLSVVRKGKFAKGLVGARYTTADETAKAGIDYKATTSTVSFQDADTTPQSFDIPLTAGQETAPNATFKVTLDTPTNGARVARPSTAIVTIQGGSGQQVAFSQPVFDVQRRDGRATITVNRTGGSRGQLTVQYRSTNMSAVAGMDYSAVSGQLTWGAGDTRPQTFDVPIVNIEGAWERKVARLILENPSDPDAPVQLGYQWQAELHITGDPKPTKGEERTRSLIRLIVDPISTTLRPGGTVSFRATAVYNEGANEDVTGVAVWQPGPGNTYTAPTDQKDNLSVQVLATFGGRTANAQVYVEVPSWSPPISHADQTGMKARPATPDMYTWYALCRKVDGMVVYGEHPDLTAYRIMGGPFEGARTAEWWINTNCASWLCQPTTGVCATAPRPGSTTGALGQESWYVLCDKKDGSIVYGKTQDYTRYFTMAGPYVGAQDATLWISSNCASGRCNPGNGVCAAGPQMAATGRAGYYALCKRNTGEVVYSTSNDPTAYLTIGGPFLTGTDAEQWISTAYPGWKCDPGTGRAVPGLPYATPPEVLAMFDQREQQHQQASRSGYGTTTTTTTTAGVTTTGGTTTAPSTGTTGTTGSGTTQWPAGVPRPPVIPGTTGTADGSGDTTPVTPPITPGTTTPVTPNQPVTPTPPITATPVPTPTPTPVPTPTPAPAPGSVVKWYVWHNCGTPGWWCVLMLTRNSENNLRAANKTLAILGSYDTEQQALQAMCPRMSGFYNGGALFVGPGVQGNIGSDKYCVKNFGWYDDAKKQWNCRQSKQ